MIRSLVSLFCPSVYNGYYLLPTIRLSLIFNKHELVATKTHLKDRAVTVTCTLSESYDTTIKEHHTQHTIALQSILKKIGNYDQAYVSFDSSIALFKDITIPFIDNETIESVLHYELEPLVAFPLSDMVYDYWIVDQDQEKQLSKIIVGFIQKDIFYQYKSICDQVELKNVHFSIDIVNASNAYKQYLTFSYHESSCWLSINNNSIKILCFDGKILKTIRSLSYSENTSLKNSAVWHDVIVTIQLFLEEITNSSKTILILDTTIDDATKTELDAYFEMQSIVLDSDHFAKTVHIALDDTSIKTPLYQLTSMLFFHSDKKFDLTNQLLLPDKIKKQKNMIITSGILIATFFTISIAHMVRTITMYKTEIEKSELQIRTELKKISPGTKSSNISSLEDAAKKGITKEINLWAPFYLNQQETVSYFLFLLSSKIDNKNLGLSLKKISLTKNKIALEGSAKDFSSLGDFERQLRETDLFVQVKPGELLSFALALDIKKKGIPA